MNLDQEDIDYIKAHIAEWVAEAHLKAQAKAHAIEHFERLLRVEERLRHQNESMEQGFKALQAQIDKGLELMDKRLKKMA